LVTEGLHISNAYHIKIQSNHQRRRRKNISTDKMENNSSMERLGKNITPINHRNRLFTNFLTNIYISETEHPFSYVDWHTGCIPFTFSTDTKYEIAPFIYRYKHVTLPDYVNI
jgi:hypothetical protein